MQSAGTERSIPRSKAETDLLMVDTCKVIGLSPFSSPLINRQDKKDWCRILQDRGLFHPANIPPFLSIDRFAGLRI